MTKQELKRLSKNELMEMLLELSRENAALQVRLRQASIKLAGKRLRIAEAGSIAEASIQLNGVLEAAQAAADQYLENVRLMAEVQDEAAPAD